MSNVGRLPIQDVYPMHPMNVKECAKSMGKDVGIYELGMPRCIALEGFNTGLRDADLSVA
jgi:hypothetical protein